MRQDFFDYMTPPLWALLALAFALIVLGALSPTFT